MRKPGLAAPTPLAAPWWVGKGLIKAPKMLAAVGHYPTLGQRTAAQIKGAELVPLAGVGHIPYLKAPPQFVAAPLAFVQ